MSEKQTISSRRKTVILRARSRCEYCLCPASYSPDTFSIEHIKPRARGGTSDLDNLALSCQGCNNRKHIKTEANDPTTGSVVSLYNPRQHIWHEHFVWSSDHLLIIGVTPMGRATIELLQLNRESVANLRRALIAIGDHPPIKNE